MKPTLKRNKKKKIFWFAAPQGARIVPTRPPAASLARAAAFLRSKQLKSQNAMDRRPHGREGRAGRAHWSSCPLAHLNHGPKPRARKQVVEPDQVAVVLVVPSSEGSLYSDNSPAISQRSPPLATQKENKNEFQRRAAGGNS